MRGSAGLVAAALLAPGCAGDPAREADRPFIQAQAQVERLDVLPALGPRAQIRVVAHGTLPDACTELHRDRRDRHGRRIQVTLTTRRESDAMCAQVVRDFSRTLTFPAAELYPGFYTLDVNGVEAVFEVPYNAQVHEDMHQRQLD